MVFACGQWCGVCQEGNPSLCLANLVSSEARLPFGFIYRFTTCSVWRGADSLYSSHLSEYEVINLCPSHCCQKYSSIIILLIFFFFLPPSLLCILHRDGKVHPLTFIHHTSTYQASMCKLMEYWLETNAYSLVNCVQHSVYSHYLSSDLQLKSCHKCSPGPLKRKRDSGIVQLQVCHLMIEDN